MNHNQIKLYYHCTEIQRELYYMLHDFAGKVVSSPVFCFILFFILLIKKKIILLLGVEMNILPFLKSQLYILSVNLSIRESFSGSGSAVVMSHSGGG